MSKGEQSFVIGNLRIQAMTVACPSRRRIAHTPFGHAGSGRPSDHARRGRGVLVHADVPRRHSTRGVRGGLIVSRRGAGIKARCLGPNSVEICGSFSGLGFITKVDAYDAFEVAGLIQAAAQEAIAGLKTDIPSTYTTKEWERIEDLKRIIPKGD